MLCWEGPSGCPLAGLFCLRFVGLGTKKKMLYPQQEVAFITRPKGPVKGRNGQYSRLYGIQFLSVIQL